MPDGDAALRRERLGARGRRAAARGRCVHAQPSSIGRDLHLQSWTFRHNANVVQDLEGRCAATAESQFPFVWTAFGNSLALAAVQTVLVLGVGTLAGYHLSRFNFSGRATFLQSFLVLHASPALTPIIPIFLRLSPFDVWCDIKWRMPG